MSLSHTDDARSDAAFAHFRQRGARCVAAACQERTGGANAPTYAFGDRERRYSAPDRIMRERLAEEGNSVRRANTSDDDIDERIKGHARALLLLHAHIRPQASCCRSLDAPMLLLRVQHRIMAILHDKELLQPSTAADKLDKRSEQDERSEDDKDALDLLTADPDFLCALTLPALQQLALFQQHTLAVTNSYIASYSASHPVDSCSQCGDQQADCMLFPCQHVVVCYECGEQVNVCLWKSCGRRVEETATLVQELPSPITRSERRAR